MSHSSLLQFLCDAIMSVSKDIQKAQPEDNPGVPLYIIPVSASTQQNLEDLERAIQEAIQEAGGLQDLKSTGAGGVVVTKKTMANVPEV